MSRSGMILNGDAGSFFGVEAAKDSLRIAVSRESGAGNTVVAEAILNRAAGVILRDYLTDWLAGDHIGPQHQSAIDTRIDAMRAGKRLAEGGEP